MRTNGLAQILLFIALFVLFKNTLACGTDPDPQTDGDADTDADAENDADTDPQHCSPPRTAVVVTTDYSTGGLALLDLDARTSVPDLITVHPDAVVRCSCGRVGVLERLGGDNLYLLEQAGDGLEPRAQYSLGRRSNPFDALFMGEVAYVTLNEADELLTVDLGSGSIIDRLSFSAPSAPLDLADEDGFAEPAGLHAFENRLYVALQRLDRNSLARDPSGPAGLAVVERSSLAVEGVIELVGQNPVTRIKPGPTDGMVLIGHAGLYSEPLDGGIEGVDLVNEESLGYVIDGIELGGSVIDFVVVTEELAYASVIVGDEGDQLVSFDPSTGRMLEVIFTGPSYSLLRVVLDDHFERRQLIVVSSDSTAPGILFFDADDGTALNSEPVSTGLPPFDLCLSPEAEGAADGDADGDVDADADADVDADADAEVGCDFPWEGVDPFADELVSFEPNGAGYGSDRLPEVVLGPPHGGGDGVGSSDVVSLGCGGSIVLGFEPPFIIDRPGPDFIVFENAFMSGDSVFAEPGQIGVSADGEDFVDFPCDPETLIGCAGQGLVMSNPESCIDPTDPLLAGGDAFDLADLGLSEVVSVRVVDRSSENDAASRWCTAESAGFDLDAIAVIVE